MGNVFITEEEKIWQWKTEHNFAASIFASKKICKIHERIRIDSSCHRKTLYLLVVNRDEKTNAIYYDLNAG